MGLNVCFVFALRVSKKEGSGSTIGNVFSGSIPDEFDADDKSDLAGMASGELECWDQLWS